MATVLLVQAIPAVDDHRHPFDSHNLYPSLNYSLHNKTLPDASFQRQDGTSPATMTIYRFELDQISLPGPRYMAYGPSVITLEVDPRHLAVLIAICAIFAGVWYLLKCNVEEEKV